MDNYELLRMTHEDKQIQLKTYEAIGKDTGGRFLVKQYFCHTIEEANTLLKEALVQAQDPNPMQIALRTVVLEDMELREVPKGFRVNYIYEKLAMDISLELTMKNDREFLHTQGLAGYRLGNCMFHNQSTNVKLFEARNHLDSEVVVKMSKSFAKYAKANAFVQEAMIQAQIMHENSTKLLDIALVNDSNFGHFQVYLVMEKLEEDLLEVVWKRKDAHMPFTETELLIFLNEITAALLEAKRRVKLKLENCPSRCEAKQYTDDS